MSLRWWTVSKISVMSYYNTLSSDCILLKQLQDILYFHIIWIPSTVMFYTTVYILTDNCEICLTFYCWLLCLVWKKKCIVACQEILLLLSSCSDPLIHILLLLLQSALQPLWVLACSTIIEYSQQEGFYRVPSPAACQTPNLEDQWLERSNSRHRESPASETMQANPSSGRWNYGREVAENFAESGDFHVTFGFFYMP